VCTYEPPAGFEGTDTFAYTVDDGHGGSDTGTVTVTVAGEPVNHDPVAVDDEASTTMGMPVDVDVLANDSDPDGDTLTVIDYEGTSTYGGAVSCTGAGVCTYEPPVGLVCLDTFTYVVGDGEGGTDVGVVSVTVLGDSGNRPPVAVDDVAVTYKNVSVDLNVLANDSDPDGDTLTVSEYDHSSDEGGTVVCTSAGLCAYYPPTGFDGVDTFDYTVSDGRGGVAYGTVTVTVNTPEQAPLPYGYYLPAVMYQTLLVPDLVVDRIFVASDSVDVVVRNRGTVAVQADEAFRVDVYIDPRSAPTGVNQPWSSLGNQGLVWTVDAPALPLKQGAVLVLSVGGSYYQPSLSNFSGSIAAGTPVYAQVDSYNPASQYGAVLEIHEFVGEMSYNNIAGPASW
jgi:hypothetical protein